MEINPFMKVPTPQTAPPPPSLTPAGPAAGQPVGDRITLEDSRGADRSKLVQKDTRTGLTYTRMATTSGVDTQQVESPEKTDFKIKLPQGPLLPADLEIEGTALKSKGITAVAHPAGQPTVSFPVQVLPDGKMVVAFGPNTPLAVFDSQTLDYGLATPSQVQATFPNGQPSQEFAALKEFIHPDGSSTVIAGETSKQSPVGQTPVAGLGSFFGATPQPQQPPAGPIPMMKETNFLQIDQKDGQISAKKVEARDVPGRPGPSMAQTVMTGLISPIIPVVTALAGGPTSFHQDTPVGATRLADGTIQTSPATMADHLKSGFKGMASGGLHFNSPLLNYLNGKKEEPINVKPFSAYGPQVIFAALASAPPVVAAGMQAHS